VHVRYDLPVVNCDDTAPELIHQIMLMGHHNHGGTALVDLAEKVDDFIGELRSMLPVGSSAMIKDGC
jgi:hypothetical protein